MNHPTSLECTELDHGKWHFWCVPEFGLQVFCWKKLLLNASRKLWLSFLLCLYVLYDHCYKYSFKKFKSQNFWEVWITGFHWHLDPVIWALPLLILLQTVCKAYFVKKSLGVIYRLWNYHYGFTTGNKFCNIYHVVWHGK